MSKVVASMFVIAVSGWLIFSPSSLFYVDDSEKAKRATENVNSGSGLNSGSGGNDISELFDERSEVPSPLEFLQGGLWELPDAKFRVGAEEIQDAEEAERRYRAEPEIETFAGISTEESRPLIDAFESLGTDVTHQNECAVHRIDSNGVKAKLYVGPNDQVLVLQILIGSEPPLRLLTFASPRKSKDHGMIHQGEPRLTASDWNLPLTDHARVTATRYSETGQPAATVLELSFGRDKLFQLWRDEGWEVERDTKAWSHWRLKSPTNELYSVTQHSENGKIVLVILKLQPANAGERNNEADD
ncbi:hypothetical protein [Neorhodopirellula pilleata]|nr:hypothetical protein [Neorhodopirellula pilleata]